VRRQDQSATLKPSMPAGEQAVNELPSLQKMVATTNYIFQRQVVTDFKKWRTVHDTHLGEIEEKGLTEVHMMNSTVDTNDVFMLLEPRNAKVGETYLTDYQQQEQLEEGVEKKGEILLVSKVKNDDYEKKGKSYCTRWFVIKLRVKDFDTWKEEYDHNSKCRQEGGLQESLMVQGVDDPNTVIILFETVEGGFARTFSENLFLAKEKFVKKVKLGKSLVCKPEFAFYNKH